MIIQFSSHFSQVSTQASASVDISVDTKAFDFKEFFCEVSTPLSTLKELILKRK